MRLMIGMRRRAGHFGRVRRGSGIAVMVIMLVLINVAVVGAVRASGDESQAGAMRAQTARAFYVAESGARVVVKCMTQDLPMPAVGSSLVLGTATATYVALPPAGQAGDAVIQGQDGSGARRLKITFADN